MTGSNWEVVDSDLTPSELLARPGHYCEWCGCHILRIAQVPGVKYCRRGHQEKDRKSRKKLLDAKLRLADPFDWTCRTPNKVLYRTRGAAVLAAQVYGQYQYRCYCGFYHLTSQQPEKHRRFEPSE